MTDLLTITEPHGRTELYEFDDIHGKHLVIHYDFQLWRNRESFDEWVQSNLELWNGTEAYLNENYPGKKAKRVGAQWGVLSYYNTSNFWLLSHDIFCEHPISK